MLHPTPNSHETTLFQVHVPKTPWSTEIVIGTPLKAKLLAYLSNSLPAAQSGYAFACRTRRFALHCFSRFFHSPCPLGTAIMIPATCTELGSIRTCSGQAWITNIGSNRTHGDTRLEENIYRISGISGRWYQVPRIPVFFEDPAAAFQLWLQPRLQAAVCYLKQKGTLILHNMWTSCGHHVNTCVKQ